MSGGQFSVYQFFAKGGYETVRRYVNAEDATRIAVDLIEVVGETGVITRIIIVDALDFTVFEWVHGKGVVFPVELADK